MAARTRRRSALTRNVSPVVNFFYYPLNPSTRDAVQFIDLTPDGGVTAIVSRSWHFGDGSRAGDPWPSHRFESDGDYDVELAVRTGNGDVVSLTRTVRVSPSD